MADKKDLLSEFNNLGCIKVGEFKLKSGIMSKYYINLRELPNKIALLKKVCQGMVQFVPKDGNLRIVGVPNGAIPIATTLAIFCDKDQLVLSKEKKTYGVEETIATNYKYLIVEDVMSTGSSIIETIEKIGGERVTQVIVIVDRESGGANNIKAKYPHIKVYSLLKISDFQEYLN